MLKTRWYIRRSGLTRHLTLGFLNAIAQFGKRVWCLLVAATNEETRTRQQQRAVFKITALLHTNHLLIQIENRDHYYAVAILPYGRSRIQKCIVQMF